MRILIFLSALIPIIAFAEPSEFDTQMKKLIAIDNFVVDGPEFLKFESEQAVRNLGKILNESSEIVQNPHAQGTIKYNNLEFTDGLQLHFRSFGSPLVIQYLGVTVTSSKWSIKHGLNVGVPAEKVLKTLGKPSETKMEEIKYYGVTQEVIFRTMNSHVTEIQFHYYSD